MAGQYLMPHNYHLVLHFWWSPRQSRHCPPLSILQERYCSYQASRCCQDKNHFALIGLTTTTSNTVERNTSLVTICLYFLLNQFTPMQIKFAFAANISKLGLQYPSPLCRLKWTVTHVIGLHVKLTILGEYDVALTTILGMLISNIVLMVDTWAH